MLSRHTPVAGLTAAEEAQAERDADAYLAAKAEALLGDTEALVCELKELGVDLCSIGRPSGSSFRAADLVLTAAEVIKQATVRLSQGYPARVHKLDTQKRGAPNGLARLGDDRVRRGNHWD